MSQHLLDTITRDVGKYQNAKPPPAAADGHSDERARGGEKPSAAFATGTRNDDAAARGVETDDAGDDDPELKGQLAFPSDPRTAPEGERGMVDEVSRRLGEVDGKGEGGERRSNEEKGGEVKR